jgi:hypothetical protein
MAYEAFVFARPGGAVLLGSPYGHVGFGFQVSDTTYCVGAVECASGQTRHDLMDFWNLLTDQPQRFMCTQNPYGPRTRYDMCKSISVATPNVAGAQAKMKAISQIDYNLLSQNCRTDTVEILETFGVTGLPGGARPSGFFGGIQAPIQPLLWPWPQFVLDVSLYSETDQYGLRDDLNLTADGAIADPACNQVDDNNPDAPQPVISCITVRRGSMALYPDQDFKGDPYVMPVGKPVNFRDLPWPDKTIRSYYASSIPFDAKAIATQNPDPRFNNPQERSAHLNRRELPPIFGPQDRAQLLRHQ